MSLLPLEIAVERILAAISPAASERIPPGDAENRFLAEPLRAQMDLPAWDNSSMDGYAVSSADLSAASDAAPVSLRIAGVIAAGDGGCSSIDRGECARIFTGSPVPAGCDAVVMQEDVVVESGQAVFREPAKPLENLRLAGEDIRRGELVAGAGDVMNLGRVMLAQAAGISSVAVGARPRIAILSTGNELLEPGSVPAPGKIIETNRTALSLMVRRAGGIAIPFPLVPDNLDATAAALMTAIEEADIVLTTGGASVGDHDLIKPALRKIGGELDFWRVSIKPGKPFLFGNANGRMVFGLPGNPVSALVTFALLVRPAILRWQGAADLSLPSRPGILATPIVNEGGRRHFVRVRVDAEGRVHSSGIQASHRLASMAASTGLLDVPAGTQLSEGTPVKVLEWW